MAKMMGPRFKMCRSLGLNVVGHPKAMDRANNTTSRASRKLSDYGIQLLEKQRLRAYYGVLEKQFAKYVHKALSAGSNPGPIFLSALETRFDNMVYRMGFARSIRQARQMVNHGHLLINGKKVDRPSYALKVGDVVSLKENSKSLQIFADNMSFGADLPYLSVDRENLEGSLTRSPMRDELPIEINEQLIIEYYSR